MKKVITVDCNYDSEVEIKEIVLLLSEMRRQTSGAIIVTMETSE